MKPPRPKRTPGLTMPRAPVGGSARVAAATLRPPFAYAHHPPGVEKPGSPRMERPRGGKGPRNPMER